MKQRVREILNEMVKRIQGEEQLMSVLERTAKRGGACESTHSLVMRTALRLQSLAWQNTPGGRALKGSLPGKTPLRLQGGEASSPGSPGGAMEVAHRPRRNSKPTAQNWLPEGFSVFF